MKIIGDDKEILLALGRQAEILANLTNAVIKLAHACESMERALTDRMDIIEGRLDEMKPKEQPGDSGATGGHKPWTQRQQDRWTNHFSVIELTDKLRKAATNVE